ncbi:MAG: archease [Candidatus Poseidoniaceae archaeon]
MSAWLWPTTADVGMRVFAKNYASLLAEAAEGMQSYLLSETSARNLNACVRKTGEWRVRSEHRPADEEFLFLAWLDELLYRSEVHGQWYVDGQVHVLREPDGLTAVAQVSFIDAEQVEREIEIKAVTTHQLVVAELQSGEVVTSHWDDVPSFEGPGWYADVVFDI